MIRFVSRTGRLVGLTNVRVALGELTNVKRLRNRSQYTPPTDTLIVNWGWVSEDERPQCVDSSTYKTLNKFSGIYVAMNKLRTFNKLKEVIGLAKMIPDYTTDYDEAREWTMSNEVVYARDTLVGAGGTGITVCNTVDDLPVDSKMYVKGVPTRHEYRVHVVGDRTLVQRKALLSNDEHSPIRNHDNGYTFVSQFTMSNSLKTLLEVASIRAVHSLGLDFGAVDLVTTATDVYILEINTAPGVTASTTVEFYTSGILNYLR